MPTNKKEGIIFTTIMCSMMVLGMSLYNLLLHDNLALSAACGRLSARFCCCLYFGRIRCRSDRKENCFSTTHQKRK